MRASVEAFQKCLPATFLLLFRIKLSAVACYFDRVGLDLLQKRRFGDEL